MKTAALLVGFCTGLALANANVFLALFRLTRQDDTASHIVLVPLVTVFLMYQAARPSSLRLVRR